MDQFCSSCGTPTIRNSNYKVAEDINCFWLEEALRERGYSIQVDDGDPNAWRATAFRRPALDLAYSHQSRIIVIMVEKTPENQSPMGKIKGFQYVNECNNGLKFWKTRWDDDDNTIYFSFMLPVADVNAKARIHAILGPVIDEMIDCWNPCLSD
jgi:hypothetical protein